MSPKLAGMQLLLSCAAGLWLGAFYGFLRPFRRKFPNLGDLLFTAEYFLVLLRLDFLVCEGDLRPGHLLGVFCGGLLYDRFLRTPADPVFRKLFQIIGWFWGIILLPFKKILIFLKILFAYLRK